MWPRRNQGSPTWEQVSISESRVTVDLRHRKNVPTGQDATVSVTASGGDRCAVRAFKQYVDAVKPSAQGAVFQYPRGTPLLGSAVVSALRDAARSSGWTPEDCRRIDMHALRTTGATIGHASGGSMAALRRWGGWSEIRSMSPYVHATAEQVHQVQHDILDAVSASNARRTPSPV